jgi:hypothetical protein
VQTLFTIFNLAVLPFWLLVIFLPGWSVTRRVAGSLWIVLPLLVVYLVLMLPNLGGVLPLLIELNLDRIAEVLGRPEGTLVAWVHFLAFDLFVGRWIYLDAQERRVPWWLSSPVLFLTLMVGPFGLLSYLLVRPLVPLPPPGSDK